MKIAITRLELTNFKCFRQKEIAFSPDVTTISGRNGVGKTTIADAILWCLFGKNTQGQSDFDLKTHDSDGNPIPNLDHSVELTLSVVSDASPSEITLKRTLKETWINKRGSIENVFKNNTTEYMVNGEVKTATDYKKFISELVGEDIFRAITNPGYFPSLKWQEQRKFLSTLASDISTDSICGNDVALQAFKDSLAGEDILAYRKHLSYQIKQVKNKLDMIPVRLEEQHKALPEPLDWSALEAEFASVASQQKEVEEKIASIRSGNGDDIRKQELRTMLDEKYRLLRTEEQRLQKKAFDQQAEHEYKVAELTRQFRQLLNDKRDLEANLPSFDKMTERCQETLAQCEKDAEKIRSKWAENNAHQIVIPDDCYCPTCGQTFPKDQIIEMRRKATEDLNREKAEVRQRLTAFAEKVKATRSDAEAELKSIEQKKADAEKNLNDIREQFNKVFSDKQKAEKEKESVPSYEFLKENSNTIAAIRIEIANLEAELQKASVTSEEDQQQLDALESQKSEYAATLSQLQSKLSSKEQYDKIQYLINGIKTEEQGLVEQLSELERKEDVAIRYQDRQNAILESRINQHFSLVQWRLFRTVNNGGDPFQEPYCECYVDGVAYHDGLNQAARLNAGLDIIATLCKHYNVSAPIVIDNSESTINILPTESQQIRLQVADTDLQIQ